MHTDADRLLDQLGAAYGEFWETWLVPTAIGAGVWCARLHADYKNYINAESPAMLGTLIDRDDELAGRKYPRTVTGTRKVIGLTATPTRSPVAASTAKDTTPGTRKARAKGGVA